MQKYLFIDRDGTLIESPPSPLQIDSIEKLRFYPQVITWLAKIATKLNFKLVMVTNQNGLGTISYPINTFLPAHNFMLDVFKNECIEFYEIIIDDSLPEENSAKRKPRIGRMTHYLNNPAIDIKNSFVIGDRITDVQFAKNLGCKAININAENIRGQKEITDTIDELRTNWTALETTSWKEIYEFLKVQ
ncbi:MAG: histidinol-phosphatase [Ferruginibacter sp.]|nr:histidinol-phosphatase [Ferruginibacter sp.]